MIDEDRTMQLYGYTSDELKPKSNKPIVAVCEECGRVRIMRKGTYKKVCRNCQQIKKPNLIECIQCGKPVRVYPSQLLTKKFCSKKCRGIWQSTNIRGENHPLYGKKIVKSTGKNNPNWKPKREIVCLQCGKKKTVRYGDINAKFCSTKCHGEWKVENACGENNPHWKPGRKVICLECEQEFRVKASDINAKFCSIKCHGKWRSKNISDETRQKMSASIQGVPLSEWKGYAVEKQYCEKFNNDCRERNRDKYGRVCFICGKTEPENGKRLSVHHVDRNKDQGCNDHNWQLIPLCVSCHAQAHSEPIQSRIDYLLSV